uniref:ribosomal RNA processing protein 36 homolog n=1 Tax=Urocitellus parryii TaxID=9999 RepID=UPI000E55BF93|nr:ribosomal RNA processing protein 36 homolog [Urocitellus parryii]
MPGTRPRAVPVVRHPRGSPEGRDVELGAVARDLSCGIADMSFEELLKLQSQVGTKTYKQLLAGNTLEVIFLSNYTLPATLMVVVGSSFISLVKKQLKKRLSGEEHEKLQQLLQRMEQQEMAQQERKRQQELRLALKQERRTQAQQGHRPYFLKKSEQRQLVLAEKFKELKRSKKLESFLSRKRHRNAGKDKRHLPLSREY